MPVITTSSNGASEIIDEGSNGFILPPDAHLADNIAEKIGLFYRLKEDEKSRMRVSAKEKAEQFTILRNLNGPLKYSNNSDGLTLYPGNKIQ